MGKKKHSDDVRVVATTIEDLPVTLSDEDIRVRGRELARAAAEVQRAELRKAQIMATCKSEIEVHSTEMSRLTEIVNNGWEFRQVEVEEVHDFSSNRVAYVRTDTAELLRERPMTPEERQRPLPMSP